MTRESCYIHKSAVLNQLSDLNLTIAVFKCKSTTGKSDSNLIISEVNATQTWQFDQFQSENVKRQ